MFKAAVGHGIDPDSAEAIQEALEQCQQALGNEIPNAGILMTAIDFEHEAIIHHIRQTYPDILLIGGTSLGEMSSEMGFQEDSLTLMLFCSDEVTFQVGVGKQASENAIAAAKTAIASATTSASTPLKCCYALGDGLGVDGAAMLKGLQEAMMGTAGTSIPIIGGLTADDWTLEKTYQFISTPEKTEVLEHAIVVMTLSGNLKISYSIATGQRPIGPKGIVTKSHNCTLYEVNGEPAKLFYDENCGEQTISLTEGGSWGSAIAVFEPGKEDFYMRTPNGDGETNGSIRYFGHVEEHATIQLTESDNDSLLAATQTALKKALTSYPGNAPAAALMISCAARLKLMGTRVAEEHSLAQTLLKERLPSIGFYSYGEISPFTEQTDAHFHNESFAVLLLGVQ